MWIRRPCPPAATPRPPVGRQRSGLRRDRQQGRLMRINPPGLRPAYPTLSILCLRSSAGVRQEVHMQAARLLATIALIAGAQAACAQEAGDARKGLIFAEKVCAECHGVKAGQTVPAAAPTFRAIANTPGMTAMALTIFFRTPHRDMPNLILSDNDRDDVIAYILSLRERK